MSNIIESTEFKAYRLPRTKPIRRRRVLTALTTTKSASRTRREGATPILAVAFAFWAVYFLMRSFAP